jgi:hypothetical protein
MAPENSSATATAASAAAASREQASEVAGTARDEARDVMQQAREEARSTARQVQEDVRERANAEASRFAQTLHDAGRQMHTMADAAGDDASLTANVVREGAQAADRLASRIEDGGVDAVLAQVRAWARQNPGGFLLGAAVGGFVAGRLARNLGGAGDNGSAPSGNTAHGEFASRTAGSYPDVGRAAGPGGDGTLE